MLILFETSQRRTSQKLKTGFQLLNILENEFNRNVF